MSDTKNNPNPSLQRKSAARTAAVQCLYQQSMTSGRATPQSQVAALKTALNHNRSEQKLRSGHAVEPNYPLLEQLLTGVAEHGAEIDTRLDALLDKGWSRERMSALLLAILRCAMFELLFGKPVKAAIIIDEYTRLTRSFFADAEADFVHAFLHKLAAKHA